MQYVITALLAAIIILLIILILKSGKNDSLSSAIQIQNIKLDEMRASSAELQKSSADETMRQLGMLERRFATLEQTNEQKLENMRRSINDSMEKIRNDNNERISSMQKTVDEKLDSKISESFKAVNERLAEVYKGLGEMKTLANGVGDLKKVLTNVKTRGILGELQLGAILDEILSPEQYETNVATVPSSTERVEFAVKLPGDNNKSVYLPIDSKFPADCYEKLLDAYDSADPATVKSASNELCQRIKAFAKDIKTKYISVPYTTDFGIMFLPVEGLYSEVIKMGLVETLQKDYHVNIAGPTTMAAMLSSLQMGFKTLAIQKRSAEVWEILGAVKTEFDKFSDVLDKAKKHIGQIDSDLDLLIGTRTNVIKRRLRDVQSLSDDDSKKLLDE